jgi:thiamine pyrophosphate-dependent acetolactate synthase large subunit-like protein
VVLDNGHYGIEQWILGPDYFAEPASAVRPYLALNRWDYPALARSMGFAHTAAPSTVAALRDALAQARDADGPALIAASIRPHDLPAGLSA